MPEANRTSGVTATMVIRRRPPRMLRMGPMPVQALTLRALNPWAFRRARKSFSCDFVISKKRLAERDLERVPTGVVANKSQYLWRGNGASPCQFRRGT
jgi:hypothetical protein